MTTQGRFDKLTERARKVLSLAHEEALRFNHSYIDTEHLLLGLVHVGDGTAARVLSSLGVELSTVQRAVEIVISGRNRRAIGEIGLTPRAKKVIELAVDEAHRLHHHYIGTEHLLLGLIREGKGIAAGVLESLGVTLEKARVETINVLGQNGDRSGTTFPVRAYDSERYDKLTEQVRKVLSLAQDEAQFFKHNYIGTEHLLLGLLREGENVAARLLNHAGADLERTRKNLEIVVGRGADRPMIGPIDLTPRSRKVIELAVDEAHRLNQDFIGTEHLLLGLIREGEGIGIGILEAMGVNLEKLRTQTIQVVSRTNLGDNDPGGDPQPEQ